MTTITSPTSANTGSMKAERRRHFGLLRIARTLAAIIILLAAIGVAYQATATEVDRRNYPAPGKMVNVGGFQMHINCSGQGNHTVILEPGGASNSLTWYLVQPEIAKTTRVCAYDRAGMGWSDPGPDPRDGQSIANELHI